MSKRIAADLLDYHRQLASREIVVSTAPARTLLAQAEALAAVARAADRHHSHAEVPYDPIDESWKCGICRALSRLSRASQPRRKT